MENCIQNPKRQHGILSRGDGNIEGSENTMIGILQMMMDIAVKDDTVIVFEILLISQNINKGQ